MSTVEKYCCCNVLEYLERSSEKFPNKIFIADENKSVTFAEAQNVARRIGSYIINKVSKNNKPIIVFVDRNVETILMFLGVVYSGNFYIPVNAEIPEPRLRAMIEHIQPELALTVGEFDVSRIIDDMQYFLYSEMTGSDIDEYRLSSIREHFVINDPLCGIFTSGSTGIPKCVVKSHKSAIFMAENFSDFFSLNTNDILGNQVNFDFDMSNKDIYLSLRNGNTLQIIPKKLFMSPAGLIRYMNERCISVLFWAASALHVMHRLHAFKHEALQYVKKVMCSGEPLSLKTLNYWQKEMPEVELWNLYGCTEMTGNCAFYKIPNDFKEEKIPMGRALPGVKLFLLDENDKMVKENEIGEICIEGETLALGYYNDADKTAEKFVQNPLNHAYPEIIYRTGDLARCDENGQLIFSGRKDYQIKHMGYRIELGDIEAVANTLNTVGRTCCLYDENRDSIVLFYEAEENKDTALRKYLRAKIPHYMVPNIYVQMKMFPENDHGKIDRVRLKSEYINS